MKTPCIKKHTIGLLTNCD
uniref:Uncharacterized protein n=1 Tax=Anguilla anguilla TaxID=7936 RepID=A0A0E9RLN7_ANGAN